MEYTILYVNTHIEDSSRILVLNTICSDTMLYTSLEDSFGILFSNTYNEYFVCAMPTFHCNNILKNTVEEYFLYSKRSNILEPLRTWPSKTRYLEVRNSIITVVNYVVSRFRNEALSCNTFPNT